MDDTQLKSTKLINEFLTSISDKEFLSEYNNCEKNIGPTISEYLGTEDDDNDLNVLEESD
ncbi:MAG: hypothetical protein PHC28_12295 [Flavobacterium sp.]|uniref:hypothetical protein n=1 Tax=Flavobacterium sp. TaxID=239 RepID=UPI002602BC6A|nr:hypothetical protein [Flavobacterium sp.]MDD5151234.1 hypothetical protein [Flavobacterium sp.]